MIPPPATPSPAIDVHDVTVAYQRKPVLWDVDVQLPAAKLIAVVGPNGAGKSTLLKAIMGLVPLASGKIDVLGRDARTARGLIGYVPQRESVDWDFPIDATGVVDDGPLRAPRLVWARQQARPRRRGPRAGTSGHERLRPPPDRPAFRRPAAARLPRTCPRAGRRALSDGRTPRRRRRDHGGGDRRRPPQHARRRKDRDRRPPRPANRARVLRPRGHAQHAPRRRGPGRDDVHAGNLQRTYGGRLTMLDAVAEAVRTAGAPT